MGFVKIDVYEFSDGYGVFVTLDELNRISGPDLAFLEHAAIKPHSTRLLETRRKIRALFHTHRQLVARYAWLRDLQHRAANTKDVTDLSCVLAQSLDRKVFTKLAIGKAIAD